MEQDGQRLTANLQILDLLREYFISNPDYRFGQGLSNLEIATHYIQPNGKPPVRDGSGWIYEMSDYRDIFFQESIDTLRELSRN